MNNSKSALASQSKFSNNGLLISHPTSISTIFFVAIILLISLFILSLTLTYSDRRKISGYVRPTEGSIRVFAVSDGVIEKIFFKAGDRVNEGDRLAIVSRKTATGFTGETKEKAILKLIQSEAQEAGKELERSKLSAKLDTDSAQMSLQYLTHALRTAQNKIKISHEIIESKQGILNRISGLSDASAISKLEVARLNQELLLEESKSAELASEKKNLERQISELNIKQKKNQIALQQIESSISSQLLDINRQQVLLSSDDTYFITAPSSGNISNVLMDVGQSIDKSSLVFTLIPEKSEQEVELLIPSAASGLLKVGQKVLLRYEAYPFQIFGLQKGVIRYMDETIIMPNEVSLPFMPSYPFYRARIELESQAIVHLGKSYQLKSGMKVDADVLLENKSIFHWIFDPFMTMLN